MPVSCHGARFAGGNRMLEMTNENFASRALHCSYGLGDDESYKKALTFLENCERYTLRSLVRRSAKLHAEVTVDHRKKIFSRALKKLDISQGHNPTLRAMILYLLKHEPLEANSQPSGNT